LGIALAADWQQYLHGACKFKEVSIKIADGVTGFTIGFSEELFKFHYGKRIQKYPD